MKAKWLICLFGHDEDVNRLFYAVQESGREAEILPLADFYRLTEIPLGDWQNIVVTGPCLITRQVYEARPDWIPGSWHNRDFFKCSTYYAFWGKYLTQQRYVMMPLAEVVRNAEWLYDLLGKDGHVFLRPDWGEKTFNGELVCREMFESWGRLALDHSAATANTITVVSEPREILKELRLLIRQGKVVTGSTYRINRHIEKQPLEDQEDCQAIIAFAERVAADNPPPLPPVYVMDIGVHRDGYSLMEIGTICAAGFYAMDIRKIVEAVSEAAEEEWLAVTEGREASPVVQLQARPDRVACTKCP